MSELWKSERYFSTFDEADTLRKSLLSGPNGATLQVKVKRCGAGGTLYVVKSRQSNQAETVEQKPNSKKSSKKTSKKTSKRCSKGKIMRQGYITKTGKNIFTHQVIKIFTTQVCVT